MKKRLHCMMLVVILSAGSCWAQRIALKTNLLYWAALTPNVELEARLTPKLTVDVSVAGSVTSIKDYKLHFAGVEPELRYWLERPMARHFVGIAGLFTNYHFQFEEKRHHGDAVGAGCVYGYAFVLSRRWNLETSVGVGMVHFREKNYRNEQPEKANHTGWAIVPMRVGVTLSYIL